MVEKKKVMVYSWKLCNYVVERDLIAHISLLAAKIVNVIPGQKGSVLQKRITKTKPIF